MATSLSTAHDSAFGSSSAIVAGDVSGYHLLKIIGYSRTKEVPKGEMIKSRPFQVGGRTWLVDYHPNGFRSENTDYISLFLRLGDTVADTVKAKITFCLLNQDGKPVPSYTKTGTDNFCAGSPSWGFEKFIDREVLEKSEYLKDDCFTVRVDVTVLNEIYTKDKPLECTPFVVVPPCDMQRHFGDLLSSKEGVDVKFLVGGETFAAHRSVLAARSPVFKVELFGPMKESTTADAIVIDDMEAQVFRAMLTFIYTGALPDTKPHQGSAMAQHLLVAADRYDLERLKLICEDKLCKHIDAGSVATILALAEQHHYHGLREACLAFFSSSMNLNAFMESEGYEYLTKTCPDVLKELTSNLVLR